MRLTVHLFLSLILFSCVATKEVANKRDVTAINYIYQLPMVQGDGQLFNILDTLSIFYYQDLVVYQLPYHFESSKTTFHVKADTVTQEVLLSEKRYNYIVFRQGDTLGRFYETIEKKSIKKLPVDSILASKGSPQYLQAILANPTKTLMQTVVAGNRKEQVEMYLSQEKPDESYSDTTYVHYSKALKHIPFSFAPALDSMRASKLYKARFVFKEMYSSRYGITMPHRELIYEIQLANATNSEQLMALFQLFQAEEKAVDL